MARTGRFTLGRVSLVQLADMVERCRQLGYGPNARVDVVLEVRDPNAPSTPVAAPPGGSPDRRDEIGQTQETDHAR